MTAPGLPQNRMVWVEPGYVVLSAEEGPQPFEQVFGAGTPGGALNCSLGRTHADSLERRAVQGADRPPYRAVGGHAIGRVGAAAAE